jgi:2-aminoadipate transaminase
MNWSTRYASRIEAIGHSDVVAILKLAERPDVISFAGGLPDPSTFLVEETKEILLEVLAERGHTALGYSPTPGVTPFREWLAEYMTHNGRPTAVEECLVTTGGIAALDLICKALLDPGDTVVVGEPSYLAALHVIKSYEGRFAGVPLDGEGMQPEALEAKLKDLERDLALPKFIYLVPSFQNPAGVTLSEKRRNRIAEIANHYDVPIVEDAAYRDLRFEGQAPPLLCSLDPKTVTHINTLSKIFNPGVRLGWVTGPSELIETLVLAKQGQDQCSTTIGQYLTHAFASRGLLERQKATAVELYRRKRDIMLQALRNHFPAEAHWTKPEGGFYTWVTLPTHMDTEALLPHAIEKASVAYVAGPAFYHDRTGNHHLRLCYSYVPETQIEEGVRRLGRLVSDTPTQSE